MMKDSIKENIRENIKPRKFLKDFREFAVKGNVVDLAVAVVIGAAFGKIVSSLVADVVMPLVSVLIGGVNFSNLKWTLKEVVLGDNGIVKNAAVTINIGAFLQNIFDFVIIALAVFLMVKIIGRLKKQLLKEEACGEVAPAPLTKDQELLAEIRDLLKK
ncbi:MAG: large-conductance mechanosensitive channel protein MscL [Patescibacteria group bacterium]